MWFDTYDVTIGTSMLGTDRDWYIISLSGNPVWDNNFVDTGNLDSAQSSYNKAIFIYISK